MARKTAAQREAEKQAAKPLHFMTTGGGKPAICGERPDFWSTRKVHVAFVTDEHLADPKVCVACAAALPDADRSLPTALFG